MNELKPPQTKLQCLMQISAYQCWLKVCEKSPHVKYAPGFFRKDQMFLATLRNKGRQSIMRLISYKHCYVPGCERALPDQSELDHLVPLSRGGANNIENVFPLCPYHNSSKGQKDLMEWWLSKGFDVNFLEHDALLHYSRLMYENYRLSGSLEDLAPNYLRDLVTKLADCLPSKQHSSAFLSIGGSNIERV